MRPRKKNSMLIGMDKVQEAYDALRERVLALRDKETGIWTGELSSSALGTALAAMALDAGDASDRVLAESGVAWIVAHANADGGWGDTPESVSNLSTTLIGAAAVRHALVIGHWSLVNSQWSGDNGQGVVDRERGIIANADADERSAMACHALARAEAWVTACAGSTESGAIARALGKVYGEDRTFAVPILAYLAMFGKDERAWLSVPPLPFLLALLPHWLYRFCRLQVVSYALPALIAVGLCRHACAARARGRRAWGRLFAGPLLKKLEALQPEHGGFLDAIPLTAFVCLSLRHAGYGTHPVAQKGLSFLRGAARGDGSWAIDSNLRTWVTSLAARAVWGVAAREDARSPRSWDAPGEQALSRAEALEREHVAAWLVAAQLKTRHPFTGAQPGGWAWTDLPGGVPDADDTAGALIALKRLKEAGCAADVSEAVRNGVRWLLMMQNADGGMPTFCKGWGRLPFDRSCPDISAHALAALAEWGGGQESIVNGHWSMVNGRGAGARDQREMCRVSRAIERLLRYLERAQEKDGSWVPLWFGHQETAGCRNPVVGTARVVDALRQGGFRREALGVGKMLARGEAWLVGAQKADGGWSAGKRATVEETALAVIALSGGSIPVCEEAARRGCAWLVAQGTVALERAAPIGLYFALLWYHERLYPLVWSLEALGRNLKQKEDEHDG